MLGNEINHRAHTDVVVKTMLPWGDDSTTYSGLLSVTMEKHAAHWFVTNYDAL